MESVVEETVVQLSATATGQKDVSIMKVEQQQQEEEEVVMVAEVVPKNTQNSDAHQEQPAEAQPYHSTLHAS